MGSNLSKEDLAKQRDARDRLERDDYNNAIAGRETGRMMRFGAKSREEREAEARKAERVFRDALDRLLDDPVYRAKYELLGKRLAEAERTADQVLFDIQAALRRLEEEITDMEDRAAKGPDGQPVFRIADGRVVNARGEEIPPEIAAGIIWPSNAPTAEEYFATRDQHAEATSQLEAWQDYRTDTLGGVRHRYEDRDNPMTTDELDEAIELIQSSAPKASTFAQTAPSEMAVESHAAPSHALPTLGS